MLSIVPFVPGESLLSHALRGGVPLLSPCGGESRCGKCRVLVTGGTRGGEDPGALTRSEIAAGIRLACRCFPSSGDVSVTILPGSRPARLAAYLDGKDLAGEDPFLPLSRAGSAFRFLGMVLWPTNRKQLPSFASGVVPLAPTHYWSPTP